MIHSRLDKRAAVRATAATAPIASIGILGLVVSRHDVHLPLA
jgi:hypothetical protein